jgi:hypothetical protein
LHDKRQRNAYPKQLQPTVSATVNEQGLEAFEPRPFRSPTEHGFPKITPVTTKGNFCQNMPAFCASGVLQLEVNVAVLLHPDIDDSSGHLVPLLRLGLTPRFVV